MTSKKRDPRGRAQVEPLDTRAARGAALDALARRDRSSEALRRKLVDTGYDPVLAGEVVERLVGEKLVDDRRYAQDFVAFHAARGQGPIRVRAELRKAGMQGELVEDALDAYPDWIAQLLKAHQKKFGTQLPTHYADGQRRARFLEFRGFTRAQIGLALGIDTDLDVDT